MLTDLLPELREHICRYLHAADISNIVLCNRQHYNDFIHILWRVVKIPWFYDPESTLLQIPRQLQFARSLDFTYQQNECGDEHQDKRWQQLVCSRYRNILKKCNVNILVSLKIEAMFSDKGLRITAALLQNLRHLSLNKCNGITERGWDMIASRLPHLENLEVCGCVIQDEYIKSITRKSFLKVLTLDQCNELSSECLSLISKLTTLEELNVSCWRFNDGECELTLLSRVKSLRKLTLSGYHRAKNDSLALLHKLTNLSELNLSTCAQLCDSGLSRICELSHLHKLSVCDCCNITDVGISRLTNHRSLTSLNISGCWKITDQGFVYLSRLVTLLHLNISCCRFVTDTGINRLIELKMLRTLNISGCRYVTDTGVSSISTLRYLNELCMGGCTITDSGLEEIVCLQSLWKLNISRCHRITDAGIANISQLKRLKRLNIYGCANVTYNGLLKLTNLNLEELNLKECSIEDESIERYCMNTGMKELVGDNGCVKGRILTSDLRLWEKQQQTYLVGQCMVQKYGTSPPSIC